MDSTQKEKKSEVGFGLNLIAAIVLIFLSLFVIAMSIYYWKDDYVDEFYYSSGLMPFMVGLVLFIFSSIYLRRTIKEHTLKGCCLDIKLFFSNFVRSKEVHKALIGLVLFFIYIYVLLGRLPFYLATFIAMFAILIFVNWNSERKAKTILKMALIAAISTAVIILVFQVIFAVPMP